MKKVIVVGLPDKHLEDLIHHIEKHPEFDKVKKMYTAFQFFSEYRRREADVIFLDTTVPDKDIRLFAEQIREIDTLPLLVGVARRKDPIMVRQFMEIIPKSDFILKTDSNEMNVKRLVEKIAPEKKNAVISSEVETIELQNKTILVVDDFENTLNIIEYTLKKSGFNVVAALSGKIAIQEIKKGLKPDLVITDLNMPFMDGFELIEELRKFDVMKDVPMFILTTEFSIAKKIKAKELNITGWIQKPYKIIDFINTITKALS